MSDLKYRLRYADQDLDHGDIAKVKLACWDALERIEALEAGLLLASNRFARVRLEFDQSEPLYFEIGEWRDEAHAASLLEEKP